MHTSPLPEGLRTQPRRKRDKFLGGRNAMGIAVNEVGFEEVLFFTIIPAKSLLTLKEATHRAGKPRNGVKKEKD